MNSLSMALDPFSGKTAGRAPQTIRDSTSEEDIEAKTKIEKNLTIFVTHWEDMLDARVHSAHDQERYIETHFSMLEFEVLKPAGIQLFYDTLVKKVHELRYTLPPYSSMMKEQLITRLIQESYHAGHNDFFIDFGQEKDTNSFGKSLKGMEGNILSIGVMGDKFGSVFKNAAYVNANIQGKGLGVGYDSYRSLFSVIDGGSFFGNSAKESTFHCKTVQPFCGYDATDCAFYIEDRAEHFFGAYATRSKFILKGNVGLQAGSGSYGCTFFASNADVIQQIKEDLGIWGQYVRRNGVYQLK